jgi:hypothetical protein
MSTRCVAVIGEAGWRIHDAQRWEPHDAGKVTVWSPPDVRVESDPTGLVRIFVEAP